MHATQTINAAAFFWMVHITSARRGRLIGGAESSVGEFPWIVSLLKIGAAGDDEGYVHFCGSGAILDSTTIATVAHCVWDKDPLKLAILAGSLTSTTNAKRCQEHEHPRLPQLRKIHSVLVHPNYTTGNKPGTSDIAVLKLETPLTFNANVKAIAILRPEDSLDNFGCCVTMGWGNNFPIAPLYFSSRKKLEMLKTKVIPNFFCDLAYPFLQGELENTVCATSGFFKGACSGDSGNPLVCYDQNRRPYLVGLGSWGWVICGDGIHPDIYTDIRGIHGFWKENKKQ